MNTSEKIEIYKSDYLLRQRDYIPAEDLAEIIFNFTKDDDYDIIESFIKEELDKKSVFASGSLFGTDSLKADNLKEKLGFTTEEELDKYAKAIRFCSFFENILIHKNDYVPYNYLNYNEKYYKYNKEDKKYKRESLRPLLDVFSKNFNYIMKIYLDNNIIQKYPRDNKFKTLESSGITDGIIESSLSNYNFLYSSGELISSALLNLIRICVGDYGLQYLFKSGLIDYIRTIELYDFFNESLMFNKYPEECLELINNAKKYKKSYTTEFMVVFNKNASNELVEKSYLLIKEKNIPSIIKTIHNELFFNSYWKIYDLINHLYVHNSRYDKNEDLRVRKISQFFEKMFLSKSTSYGEDYYKNADLSKVFNDEYLRKILLDVSINKYLKMFINTPRLDFLSESNNGLSLFYCYLFNNVAKTWEDKIEFFKYIYDLSKPQFNQINQSEYKEIFINGLFYNLRKWNSIFNNFQDESDFNFKEKFNSFFIAINKFYDKMEINTDNVEFITKCLYSYIANFYQYYIKKEYNKNNNSNWSRESTNQCLEIVKIFNAAPDLLIIAKKLINNNKTFYDTQKFFKEVFYYSYKNNITGNSDYMDLDYHNYGRIRYLSHSFNYTVRNNKLLDVTHYISICLFNRFVKDNFNLDYEQLENITFGPFSFDHVLLRRNAAIQTKLKYKYSYRATEPFKLHGNIINNFKTSNYMSHQFILLLMANYLMNDEDKGKLPEYFNNFLNSSYEAKNIPTIIDYIQEDSKIDFEYQCKICRDNGYDPKELVVESVESFLKAMFNDIYIELFAENDLEEIKAIILPENIGGFDLFKLLVKTDIQVDKIVNIINEFFPEYRERFSKFSDKLLVEKFSKFKALFDLYSIA